MTDHRHPAGPDLMAWRDDELPPPAAQAIADHVAACAACRAEVQALDQARGLLAGDPAPPLAPAWPRIAASRARDDRLGRPFAWAAAAACAAGLAAGLLVGSPAADRRCGRGILAHGPAPVARQQQRVHAGDVLDGGRRPKG